MLFVGEIFFRILPKKKKLGGKNPPKKTHFFYNFFLGGGGGVEPEVNLPEVDPEAGALVVTQEDCLVLILF